MQIKNFVEYNNFLSQILGTNVFSTKICQIMVTSLSHNKPPFAGGRGEANCRAQGEDWDGEPRQNVPAGPYQEGVLGYYGGQRSCSEGQKVVTWLPRPRAVFVKCCPPRLYRYFRHFRCNWRWVTMPSRHAAAVRSKSWKGSSPCGGLKWKTERFH